VHIKWNLIVADDMIEWGGCADAGEEGRKGRKGGVESCNKPLFEWQEEHGGRPKGERTREGIGKIVFPDGEVYTGEFKMGQVDGYGVQLFHHGRRYEGQWVKGSRHGHGILIFAQDERYTGEFIHGRRHGVGLYLFPDGECFEGEWKEGNPHNYGIKTFPTGETYRGEWKNGRRSGFGIQYLSDGAHYEGEWMDGKRHGVGILIYSCGTKYTGQFRKGKADGIGVKEWGNGCRYEGEWKNGRMQGKGVHTNGCYEAQREGIWEGSSLVERKKIFSKEFRQEINKTLNSTRIMISRCRIMITAREKEIIEKCHQTIPKCVEAAENARVIAKKIPASESSHHKSLPSTTRAWHHEEELSGVNSPHDVPREKSICSTRSCPSLMGVLKNMFFCGEK
jgi:hypothetical protein